MMPVFGTAVGKRECLASRSEVLKESRMKTMNRESVNQASDVVATWSGQQNTFVTDRNILSSSGKTLLMTNVTKNYKCML